MATLVLAGTGMNRSIILGVDSADGADGLPLSAAFFSELEVIAAQPLWFG